jgi:pimeloyl-ACP methyl ester carboxylesterase
MYYGKKKLIKHVIILIVIFVQLLLFNGCSTKVGMFLHGNIIPLTSYQYAFSDGYSGTYYVHRKGAKDSDVIVFFIGGSGHTSYNYYLRHFFSEMDDNVTIYALQKRYVKNRETGMGKASNDFQYHNYHAQFVNDQREFIQWVLKSNDFSQKKIMLFGFSEGGNVSVELVSDFPEITHLLVLGSGGMPALEEFKLWGSRYRIDFDLVNQEAQKYPNSIEQGVAGQSYKYWASILPFKPMEHLKFLTIPIFFAIGEKDESAPVESVYYLQNEFSILQKENLFVKVFPDCNHTLTDSNGKSHMDDFFDYVSEWLNR